MLACDQMHSRAPHWIVVALFILFVVPSCHRATEDLNRRPPRSVSDPTRNSRRTRSLTLPRRSTHNRRSRSSRRWCRGTGWSRKTASSCGDSWMPMSTTRGIAATASSSGSWPGGLAPSWLVDEGMETVPVLGPIRNVFDYCEPTEVPVPWDPVLQKGYSGLLEGLASWMRESTEPAGQRRTTSSWSRSRCRRCSEPRCGHGFGSDVVCPDGTQGAGHNLAGVNRSRWLQVASV